MQIIVYIDDDQSSSQRIFFIWEPIILKSVVCTLMIAAFRCYQAKFKKKS